MKNLTGFTLVEILVVMTIIAFVAVLSTPYLFGVNEKSILTAERDKLISLLEIARQQSIAAENGYSYSVILEPPGTFRIDPDGKSNTFRDVVIEKPQEMGEIKFEKLSGRTSQEWIVVLSSSRFVTTINISPEGVITAGSLIRK